MPDLFEIQALAEEHVALFQTHEPEAMKVSEFYDPGCIVAFSDASFAQDGERSQQCLIVAIAVGIIMWRTSRQTIVSQSTAEAELLAAIDDDPVA